MAPESRLWTPNQRRPPRPEWHPRLNRTHPLTRGLQRYWLFNQGVGPLVYDLLYNRGMSLTATWQKDIRGQVPTFNGSSEQGNSSQALAASGKLTFAFWLKVNSFGASNQIVFETSPNFNNNNNALIFFYENTDGKWHVCDQSGTTWNGGYFNTPSAGIWHHYGLVYDSSLGTGLHMPLVVVDGVVQTVTQDNFDTAATTYAAHTLYIASRSDDTDYLGGRLSDLAVYSRALTLSEIKALYLNPYGLLYVPPSRTRLAAQNITTYFGFIDTSSLSWDYSCACLISNPAVAVFTCPGSGPQTLTELSVYTRYNGTAFDLRVGIYDTDYNLIAQGTSAVTISGGSARWAGHVGAVNISPNPTTLTGGETYVLVVTKSGDNGVSAYNGNYGGNAWDWNLGYQNPLPASFTPPAFDTGFRYLIRAGVEPEQANTQSPTKTAEYRIQNQGVVRVGDIVEHNVETGNISITVPDGATIAIASMGVPAAHNANSVLKLDGQTFQLLDGIAYANGVNGCIQVKYCTGFSTGANKSLEISAAMWSTGSGHKWILQFFSGATQIRDFTSNIGPIPYVDDKTIESAAIDVVDGDYACVAGFGYTDSEDASVGSQTQDYNTNNAGITDHAFGHKIASATGTTTMQFNGKYPSMVAWSFLPTRSLTKNASYSIQKLWKKGFNFRATSGFVGDGTYETYDLGGIYPVNRNDATFGWDEDRSTQTRDRYAGGIPELAGICFQGNGSFPRVWRCDLPRAGNYKINIACGDHDNEQQQYIEIGDNGSYTVIGSGVVTSADSYMDADGTVLSAANWPNNNTQIVKNFTSTVFQIRIANGGSSQNSTLTHVTIEEVGPAKDATYRVQNTQSPTKSSTYAIAGYYADEFTGEENPISTPWTSGPGGYFDAKKSGGTFRAAVAGADTGAVFTSGTFANDQWGEVVLAAHASGANGGGPAIILRAQPGSANSYVAYFATMNQAFQLYRVTNDGATWTQLGTPISYELQNGDVVKAVCTGEGVTTIDVFVNGSFIGGLSDSPTTYSSGKVGLNIYDYALGENQWDSFRAGDVRNYSPTKTAAYKIQPTQSPTKTAAYEIGLKGLDFHPPSYDLLDESARLQWTNPHNNGLPIYGPGGQGVTYIWRYRPRRKAGYYTTLFWGNAGEFSWNSGQPDTFYGAHPYPPDGLMGTSHKWEVSTGTHDEQGADVVYDTWYTQALRVWEDGSGNKHHEFYWDLPNTDAGYLVSYTQGPTYGETNPPSPALCMGMAQWTPKEYQDYESNNGIIRGIQIYNNLLSVSDVLSEVTNPLSTSAGLAAIWYLNANPSLTDVTDHSGQGHHPSLVGNAKLFGWSDTAALQFQASVGGQGNGVSQVDCDFPITVAAGDLIAAYVKWEDADRTPSVAQTDSGNSLTPGTKANYNGGPYGQWFYKVSASAASGVTFRASFGSVTAYCNLLLFVFRPKSGYTASLVTNSDNPASGSSDTPQSGNISTPAGSVVVLGGYSAYVANLPTNMQVGDTNADWLQQTTIKLTDYTTAWFRFLSGAGSSIHAQCTNTSGSWVCGVIAFEAVLAEEVVLDQSAVRWRNDDGDEANATWAADENAGLTGDSGAKRIRVQINNTGDPEAITPQFDWRRKPSGGSFGPWSKVN